MRSRGEAIQTDIMAALQRRGSPMSAYDLLDVLRQRQPKMAPPTIYRALSALVASGRIHRLESLKAFVACQCVTHGHTHDVILSICDDCGKVEETVAPDVLRRVSRVAGVSGFIPDRHVIELHGRCGACVDAETIA